MTLARKVATVGAATLLSRLLGFARDVGIAALLGAGTLTDAFFAAMLAPNLFRRLLAEGALNSAFVPAWLRLVRERGTAGAQRFGEDVLGAMLTGLGLFVLAGVLAAPVLIRLLAPGFSADDPRFALAAGYLRLALPYVAIAGAVAVLASVLNAEGRVGAVSFGLIVYNGVLLAALAYLGLTGVGGRAGEVLSLAVVLAGLAQLAVVASASVRLAGAPRRPRLRPSSESRRFFAQALPGLVAAGIPQLKLVVGAMVASSSPSAVSWLYYAYRLYELPLGVVSVAVASVMAPLIASSLHSPARDTGAAQSRAFEMAFGLALPAAVGLAVLARPIAAALFEHGAFGPDDTRAVGAALAAIAAGLPGHALEKVLGSVCFAHEDTRTPMLAALAGLAVATLGATGLFPAYGHVGIAVAIAGSGWVGASLLAFTLVRRDWLDVDAQARRRLPRIIVAATVMGVVLLACRDFTMAHALPAGAAARLAGLAVLIAAGLGVYLLALRLLGAVAPRELVGALRDRP